MKNIVNVFTDIVCEFNNNNITPIVYGSLGLYLTLKKAGVINDIDLLLEEPEEFEICKKILVEKGFKIDPLHEKELIGEKTNISLLNKIDIEKLINEPLETHLETLNGAKFYNVVLSQHHKIYTNGLKSEDRKKRKLFDDLQKINKIGSNL